MAGLLKMFLFLGVLVLAVCVVFIYVPQDLSDVDGYGGAPGSSTRRDLKAVLRSSVERGYELTLTEEEINGFLARTLAARQGGVLGKSVTLDGAWVRLEAGQAEIVLERRILGHSFTISSYLQIAQTQEPEGVRTEALLHGGPYLAGTYPNRGGRFGRLVVPQGFLRLVLPSFQKLASLYQEEVDSLAPMARIRIEEGRIVFNPHAPDEMVPGPGGSF